MISNSAATHAKVAIYIRVSTLHQIDRDSLPMQRQDLIAYAKLILNTDDVTIFEDAGYSGKNTIRPEFQKMMSQLRTGTYTHLLVWKIDRISRNLLDFARCTRSLKTWALPSSQKMSSSTPVRLWEKRCSKLSLSLRSWSVT